MFLCIQITLIVFSILPSSFSLLHSPLPSSSAGLLFLPAAYGEAARLRRVLFPGQLRWHWLLPGGGPEPGIQRFLRPQRNRPILGGLWQFDHSQHVYDRLGNEKEALRQFSEAKVKDAVGRERPFVGGDRDRHAAV